MSDRITLSLDQEAEHLQNQLDKQIENVYGGKSAFYRSCLRDYDKKSRYQAKLDLINQRIESLQSEIEELELQKEGLERKVEKIKVENKKEIKATEVDPEFWDDTVEKIFKRKTSKELPSVRKRYNKWFDKRHQGFCNKYKEVPVEEFQELLIEEARKRDVETDKIQKLVEKVGMVA